MWQLFRDTTKKNQRLFKTGVKMDMAPEVMAPRIKKVFDAVNKSRKPEFFRNRFSRCELLSI